MILIKRLSFFIILFLFIFHNQLLVAQDPYFIDYSLGSSFELTTQLLVAKHRKHITEETFNKIDNKIEEFQRMTMSFQNGLN